MFEAQPLHRIVQLDIDTQIVSVELQRLSGLEAALCIHIEDQFRYRPGAPP